MWIEVVAAAMVGVSLLWLVFEPVFARANPAGPDALGLDAFDEPEDTRSGVALTALKEIEFDRETGKLSEADYGFLKQKYTVEALAALREEADETPADVESLVAARVESIRAGSPAAADCPMCGIALEADARFCSACGHRVGSPSHCGSCGSELAAGTRFCGSCGGRVAA
jgi:predicted nucleic acid-binding Zn ribbon protein